MSKVSKKTSKSSKTKKDKAKLVEQEIAQLRSFEVVKRIMKQVDENIKFVEHTIKDKTRKGHDIDIWKGDLDKLKRLKKQLEWYQYAEY